MEAQKVAGRTLFSSVFILSGLALGASATFADPVPGLAQHKRYSGNLSLSLSEQGGEVFTCASTMRVSHNKGMGKLNVNWSADCGDLGSGEWVFENGTLTGAVPPKLWTIINHTGGTSNSENCGKAYYGGAGATLSAIEITGCDPDDPLTSNSEWNHDGTLTFGINSVSFTNYRQCDVMGLNCLYLTGTLTL